MVFTVKIILVFVTSLAATQAQARLISATLPIPSALSYSAIHHPTGCEAMVVLQGETIVKALITDEKCLPKGVKARDIPGTVFDFIVTPK